MLSFTYGEKNAETPSNFQLQSSNGNKKESTSSDLDAITIETNSTITDKKNETTPEYILNGKDWFYVPDYAGEAASCVKLQILQIINN
jgi:hypothetical protein